MESHWTVPYTVSGRQNHILFHIYLKNTMWCIAFLFNTSVDNSACVGVNAGVHRCVCVFYCTSSAIWSARVCRSASSLRMSDSSAMMTVELWPQTRRTGKEKEREGGRLVHQHQRYKIKQYDTVDVALYSSDLECKKESKDFDASVGIQTEKSPALKQHTGLFWYQYDMYNPASPVWVTYLWVLRRISMQS